jgi:small subunit ribosomal protein S9
MDKIKEEIKKEKKAEEKPKSAPKSLKYFEATGRRKTSIARVRLSKQADRVFIINGKPLDRYFQTLNLQQIVLSPFKLTSYEQFSISAVVKGGGTNSQAEAVRHGISKCLLLFDPEIRKVLKKLRLLTRDPRMRERKKFGLKRARRAPQWQKR